jgi:hypothetical protein
MKIKKAITFTAADLEKERSAKIITSFKEGKEHFRKGKVVSQAIGSIRKSRLPQSLNGREKYAEDIAACKRRLKYTVTIRALLALITVALMQYQVR